MNTSCILFITVECPSYKGSEINSCIQFICEILKAPLLWSGSSQAGICKVLCGIVALSGRRPGGPRSVMVVHQGTNTFWELLVNCTSSNPYYFSLIPCSRYATNPVVHNWIRLQTFLQLDKSSVQTTVEVQAYHSHC